MKSKLEIFTENNTIKVLEIRQTSQVIGGGEGAAGFPPENSGGGAAGFPPAERP